MGTKGVPPTYLSPKDLWSRSKFCSPQTVFLMSCIPYYVNTLSHFRAWLMKTIYMTPPTRSFSSLISEISPPTVGSQPIRSKVSFLKRGSSVAAWKAGWSRVSSTAHVLFRSGRDLWPQPLWAPAFPPTVSPPPLRYCVWESASECGTVRHLPGRIACHFHHLMPFRPAGRVVLHE